MNDKIESTLEVDKKAHERSVSYPGISLQETLAFIEKISRSFIIGQNFTRDDVAAVLEVPGSSIVRQVAAASQFGLLEKSKEGYKLNDIYKRYKNPINDAERKEILHNLFRSPKIFNDLIQKYNGSAIPNELKTILIRFHEITEKAAPSVASLFVENAVFIGAIVEDNILAVGIAPPIENAQRNESISEVEYIEVPKITDNKSLASSNNLLLLADRSKIEEEKVKLTGSNRYAFIYYPLDLNDKDIEVLKRRIEDIESIIK